VNYHSETVILMNYKKSLKWAKVYLKMELARVYFMTKWVFNSFFICQITSFSANSPRCFMLLHCGLSLRESKLWFWWIVRNVLGLKVFFITNWVIFLGKKISLGGCVGLCVPWADGRCMHFWCFNISRTIYTESCCLDTRYWKTHLVSFSKPKTLRTASYECGEHCWILKFDFVAGKCNKIFLFVSFKH